MDGHAFLPLAAAVLEAEPLRTPARSTAEAKARRGRTHKQGGKYPRVEFEVLTGDLSIPCAQLPRNPTGTSVGSRAVVVGDAEGAQGVEVGLGVPEPSLIISLPGIPQAGTQGGTQGGTYLGRYLPLSSVGTLGNCRPLVPVNLGPWLVPPAPYLGTYIRYLGNYLPLLE